MDLVYTFRKDIRTRNEQLIYSLRSVEKFMSGIDRIFVIGYDPKLPGVTHIEHPDKFGAAKNILHKMIYIAENIQVSEDFIYMADDHYLTRPVEAKAYPLYVNGTLEELYVNQNNFYKNIIKNTINALTKAGITTRNFNVHCPIVYNTRKLLYLSKIYDIHDIQGFVLKSLYMNTFLKVSDIPSLVQIKDCKIRTNFDIEEIEKRILGRDCWSSGKEWECPNIGLLLKKMFPNKSKYE